jgi:crossover junction endodeoxyribonuclease RusA
VTAAALEPVSTEWQLDTFVPGRAAPQGSKRHVGHGILVESSKAVAPWRTTVAWSVSQVWKDGPLTGEVQVELEFVMPRPAGTPKRRTPPAVKRPDIDKLARAVLDALSKVVWADDSLITDLHPTKRLAEIGEQPGCYVRVRQREAS